MENQNVNSDNYLLLARRARVENNVEDAKRYYDLVRTENPDNAEARFFYLLYRLFDGKKGEITSLYFDICNAIAPILKSIAKTNGNNVENAALIADMFKNFKDLPSFVNRIQNEFHFSSMSSTCRTSIETLYKFGDTVEEHFFNSAIINIGVEAWKDGVKWQQHWFGVGVDKSLPEKYVNKIKKYDSSYTLPKKSGCISFKKM